ncbi:hypothetical protein KI387_009515 [Taxus chinensis]|uniref:Kinesin motor domain-containing protein n=1 Tax=Taxus chinensis TaxID=29808 RepID=A0AA38FJF0_TAXCH|nr:hypothetical protein KI387_009515 [Taxus chinensis]
MVGRRSPMKTTTPTPTHRRNSNKQGTENVPPEDENVRANALGNTNNNYSPASGILGKAKAVSSPSLLPPRPPQRKLQRKLCSEFQGQGDQSAVDRGVKVMVRMRPLTREEEQQAGDPIAHTTSENTITVADHHFTFDAVAGTHSTQEEIFEMVGVPLVENCLAGFNSSIFAYGQTGSGKTYTMWGPSNMSTEDKIQSRHRGITPRVFEKLFTQIQEEEDKNVDKLLQYRCRCSFLEIYNEHITDLLEPSRRNLQIREDTKCGVYVENLTEEYVASLDDINQLLFRGLSNRRVGATSINAESSRSHCVFTCVLEFRCKSMSDGMSSLRTSRINLVDLAGSERQKLTGAAGERLKEAGNINRSLSQLGNLINILAEVSQGKQRHIPYRDSRLTFLLQESLGGNAKLAMICAISPASSCRSETLSTLRFAKRAKAIQNQAVVNEETENDINSLREQIRLLKDELVRMQSNDNTSVRSSCGGYSTGWNARRSFNILRLSLNCSPTLQHTDANSDEDMEMDEEYVEKLNPELGNKSKDLDETVRNLQISSISEKVTTQLETEEPRENAESKPRSFLEATKVEPVLTYKTRNSLSGNVNFVASEVEPLSSAAILDIHSVAQKDEQVASKHLILCTDKAVSKSTHDALVSVNHSPGKSLNEQSPSLSIIPCELSPTLLCPTLSVSPRIKDNRSPNESMQESPLTPSVQGENSKQGSELLSISFGQSLRKNYNVCSSMQSNKTLTSPTESLAASLHRGLQIIDSHQQNSALRKSSVRFSFKTLDAKVFNAVDKVDIGIQTSAEKSTAATSPIAEFLCACNKLDTVQKTPAEENMQDKSTWQLIAIDEPKTPDGSNLQLIRAVKGVLAGAIRREMALEETCNKQAAEIEQLNRLVRQYKHERECNSILQQSREEKIIRLEGLVDGVIPEEDFMNEDFLSLMDEHKVLKDKFEHHPEVTRANIEQKRLLEELEKYRNFHELGERDALLEEIQNLRSQLLSYLDPGSSSMSIRKQRLSLTPHSMQRRTELELSESDHSLALCRISETPTHVPTQTADDANPTAMEVNHIFHDEIWEEERQQWIERESEWISLAEELRADLDSHRRLAEKRKHEVECEQRCTQELKEALQMAMEAHARLLDQYAELQEKHIALLARHRKIKEGVSDIKQAAAKAGVKGSQMRFIEAQAAELLALKLERDREKKRMKEEIKVLQDQLRDTAEAVQAAGELLVRLKEAEEAVSIAQDSAAIAEQNAEIMHREVDKLNRKHATEMAVLNQRLMESRLLKSIVCPMCQVADRVKFEFPPADEAILEAEAAANEEKTMGKTEWKGDYEPFPHAYEDNDFLRMGGASWYTGYDRCNF